jgi:hypothetical protein
MFFGSVTDYSLLLSCPHCQVKHLLAGLYPIHPPFSQIGGSAPATLASAACITPVPSRPAALYRSSERPKKALTLYSILEFSWPI